jgi:hypothetical protein
VFSMPYAAARLLRTCAEVYGICVILAAQIPSF